MKNIYKEKENFYQRESELKQIFQTLKISKKNPKISSEYFTKI